MITNLAINLTEEERAALCLLLTGKKGLATRAQVKTWAKATLDSKLKKPEGEQTELRTTVCPKCSRPISIPVPTGAGAAKPKMERVSKSAKKAADQLHALTDMMVELATALGDLK